ncbi:tetratricopeptide repeat protein [bacterium]|nr:tetratricopeptide repeat protein [candidate division CSSED10-310 bacterium]
MTIIELENDHRFLRGLAPIPEHFYAHEMWKRLFSRAWSMYGENRSERALRIMLRLYLEASEYSVDALRQVIGTLPAPRLGHDKVTRVLSDPAFLESSREASGRLIKTISTALPEERMEPTLRALVHLKSGSLAYRCDELAKALRELELALFLDVSLMPVRRLLARVYYDLGHRAMEDFGRDSRLAESYFKHVLDMNPGDYQAHRLLGVVFFQQGRVYEAIEQFRRALKLNQHHARIYGSLGIAFFTTRREALGFRTLQFALRLAPDDPFLYNYIGLMYFMQRRYDDAAVHLSRAVELAPEEPFYHCNLGNALLRLHRFSQAEFHFLRSLEIKRNYITALFNLALTCQLMNRREMARRRYLDIITLCSEKLNYDSDHLNTLVIHGLALWSVGQPDQAFPVLRRVLSNIGRTNLCKQYLMDLELLEEHGVGADGLSVVIGMFREVYERTE